MTTLAGIAGDGGLLGRGLLVGRAVGRGVGRAVGSGAGEGVRAGVGRAVGVGVERGVICGVGASVGAQVGSDVGLGPVGIELGPGPGLPVAAVDGATVHGGRGVGPFTGSTPISEPSVAPATASARTQASDGLAEPERCMSMVHRDASSLIVGTSHGNCRPPRVEASFGLSRRFHGSRWAELTATSGPSALPLAQGVAEDQPEDVWS